MHNSPISLTILLICTGLVVGCAAEKTPRSVTEFLDNPIMLEAAMVRCSQNRDATRYDAECINARQAVGQIEAKEEASRRVDLEARSEAKRHALRRTQEAVAQARRRASDAERLREEAEYLAQFGVVPREEGEVAGDDAQIGNSPRAVIPESEVDNAAANGNGQNVSPATDGGNAPVMAQEPEAKKTDLESIRDELQRRNEEGEN